MTINAIDATGRPTQLFTSEHFFQINLLTTINCIKFIYNKTNEESATLIIPPKC